MSEFESKSQENKAGAAQTAASANGKADGAYPAVHINENADEAHTADCINGKADETHTAGRINEMADETCKAGLINGEADETHTAGHIKRKVYSGIQKEKKAGRTERKLLKPGCSGGPEVSVSPAQAAYLKKEQLRRIRIAILRVLIFAFFLALWETAVQLKWIDGFIFSSPSRIARTFSEMWKDRSIFLHTGVTLLETLVSFALVVVFGTGLAVLLWYNTELSAILEPYLVVLNSLPKSALAPLLIVWLGANQKSIIVSGMSVALFGTVLNLYTGFRATEPDKIRLIYTLQGTRKDVLFKVVLPGTLPLLLSVMKVNIGLCLVGVVIGEFIGAREGLGYLIIYGTQVFKLDWVILSITLLCIIAALLYGTLGLLERRCLRTR